MAFPLRQPPYLHDVDSTANRRHINITSVEYRRIRTHTDILECQSRGGVDIRATELAISYIDLYDDTP